MMTYSEPEFFVYPELESTNTELKKLLNKNNLPENSVVITPYQTAGRGQIGNGWESELNKNLTFSLLLKPFFLAPHLQFYISKVVSLAIVDTIKQVADIKACIKWPNDIYVDDSKVCGILIENSILGSQLDYCIAGIGLNVNQENFTSGAPNPASLKQLSGKVFNLELVLDRLLENIEQRYHELEINRLKLIDKEYFNALYRKDGMHAFEDKNGRFKASIYHISEMGIMTLMDTNGKKREYAFKEVSFVV